MRFCGRTVNATNGHFLLNRIWNVSPTEAVASTAARGRSQACMWRMHLFRFSVCFLFFRITAEKKKTFFALRSLSYFLDR